jgi:hypothetical protein
MAAAAALALLPASALASDGSRAQADEFVGALNLFNVDRANALFAGEPTVVVGQRTVVGARPVERWLRGEFLALTQKPVQLVGPERTEQGPAWRLRAQTGAWERYGVEGEDVLLRLELVGDRISFLTFLPPSAAIALPREPLVRPGVMELALAFAATLGVLSTLITWPGYFTLELGKQTPLAAALSEFVQRRRAGI